MIPRLIRKLIERPQRRARRQQETELQRLRPTTPYSDDTYLVAYPKSGNTWFSFLIANVNLLINHLPVQATWWNIRSYVFDVHASQELPPNPLPLPPGRFINSHSEFNRTYGRVIYLIRDPRDTFASYYDMTTKIGWFKGSMDEFLTSKIYGIPAWNRHVEGWVRKHWELSLIHFIRYEDLKNDPITVLARMYRLYGIPVDKAVFETAVERSSFKVMRESEAEYRKNSFDLGSTFQLVRNGVVEGFSDELTPGQIDLIEEKCAEWMKLFDYLPTSKGA